MDVWDPITAQATSTIRDTTMVVQRVVALACMVTAGIVLALLALNPPFLRRPATESEISNGWAVGSHKVSWPKVFAWGVILFSLLVTLLWSSEMRR